MIQCKRRSEQSSSQRKKGKYYGVYGNNGKYRKSNKQQDNNFNCNTNNNDKCVEYLCKKYIPSNYPAYGKICRNCNKYNHFEVDCKFKNKNVMETIKVNNTTSSNSSEDSLFHINKIKNIDFIKYCRR